MEDDDAGSDLIPSAYQQDDRDGQKQGETSLTVDAVADHKHVRKPKIVVDEAEEADDINLNEEEQDENGRSSPPQIMQASEEVQLSHTNNAGRSRAKSILEPSSQSISKDAAQNLDDDDAIDDEADKFSIEQFKHEAQSTLQLEDSHKNARTQDGSSETPKFDINEPPVHQYESDYSEQHSSVLETASPPPIAITSSETASDEKLKQREIDIAKAAWIPPPDIMRILEQRQEIGTYGADVSVVVSGSPGIHIETIQNHPLIQFAERHGVESLRPRAGSIGQSSQDQLRGIENLLCKGYWVTAVNETSQFLARHGQGVGTSGQPTPVLHTPDTLKVWYMRILALCQMHMFDAAEKELSSFGSLDRPDLFFEYYAKQQHFHLQQGSMVPFGLRVLYAEIPARLGKASESLDRLFSLAHTCDEVLSSFSEGSFAKSLWNDRLHQVRFALANAFCILKDYRVASRIYERILVSTDKYSIHVLSLLGRIALLAGDVHTAQRRFLQVEELFAKEAEQPQALTNTALIELARGDYLKSAQIFKKAMSVSSAKDTILINNFAVMNLYSGDHASTLRDLEAALRELTFPTETIMFNLASLYELKTKYDGSRKKEWISTILERAHDGFKTESLKMIP